MTRKQYVLYIVAAIVVILLGVYFFYEKNRINNSLQTPNLVVPESPFTSDVNNQNSQANSQVQNGIYDDVKFKSEATIKSGKRVVYKNQDFGLQFTYNSEAYTAPKIIREENPDQNLQVQNVIISSDNTFIGEWATATGSVRIYKESRPENYLQTEIAQIKSYDTCTIVNQNKIDGQPAVRYTCGGMGDPETVFIKHPKGYFLRIDASFPGEHFNEIVKNLTLLL